MANNPLTKSTVVNPQGRGSPTLKTIIPALVRDILELEPKDKIQWEIHPETRSVTLTKENATPINRQTKIMRKRDKL